MAETYDVVAALADALVARGLEHVCISPGSRSTPLALTFARHPRLSHWIHHDERSAAFFALGIGRATGTPAAVVTTSGTAAAELYPAVIEARFGRVPLLLLTADRPPRLRGTGANQTIDQVDLYGSSAKYFADVPPAQALERADVGGYAAAAWGAALAAPAGPAHLNLPFDEPLVPAGPMPAFDPGPAMPWTPEPDRAADDDIDALQRLVVGRRAVLVAGPLTDRSLVEPLVDVAAAAGLPIIADPLSGLRAGSHERSHVVGYGDALAQAGFLETVAPEAVIRFGPLPVSKAVTTWLAGRSAAEYAVVDTTGWPDPGGRGRVVRADPGATAVELAERFDAPGDPGWLESWRIADGAARAALRSETAFSELVAIDTVLRSVAEPATIWIASSMPIRHVDLVLGSVGRRLQLLGNRGASGIDGFISSALGSAAATRGRTVALAGDLSLLYDLASLAWAGRNGTDITIVVVNNDGGGIFSLLPQAPLPEFEELFATPHGLDFADAARWAGVDYTLATDRSDLAVAVARPGAGPHLIEVQFDRADSAAAYRRAIASVREALSAR
jgi:2-succinyl-5-enolpyruvyl-6-hydroxy-3-cyclohexene-1-carboxylate synthase